MKKLNINENEVELLDRAIENEIKSLDKITGNLLKNKQVDAVIPIKNQIDIFQKLREKIS